MVSTMVHRMPRKKLRPGSGVSFLPNSKEICIQDIKVDRLLTEGGGCTRIGWYDGYLLVITKVFYDALERLTKEAE